MYDKIIDDYLDEVTQDMGTKQRDEVARELRTHILDSADALAAERKTKVDEVVIREVIAKMGPAAQMAALYPTKKTFLAMKETKGMWDVMKVLAGVAVMFALAGVILMIAAPDTFNTEAVQIIFQVVFALGIAAFVMFFIARSVQSVEQNLLCLTWLGVIYNSYWVHQLWSIDPATSQQDLEKATQSAIQQIKDLLDRYDVSYKNRPALAEKPEPDAGKSDGKK
jgi:lysylphosphatidylglycerol synthetase-like protein (DUF2156 family)